MKTATFTAAAFAIALTASLVCAQEASTASKPILPVQSDSVLILPPETDVAYTLDATGPQSIGSFSFGIGVFDSDDPAFLVAPGKVDTGFEVNGEFRIHIPDTPLHFTVRGYYATADLRHGAIHGYTRYGEYIEISVNGGDFSQYGASAELRCDLFKADTLCVYISAGGLYDKAEAEVEASYYYENPYARYSWYRYDYIESENKGDDDGFGFIGHLGVEWIFLNDFYLNAEIGGMSKIYDEYTDGKAQADIRGVLGYWCSDNGRIDLYARYLTEWEALHAGAQVTFSF